MSRHLPVPGGIALAFLLTAAAVALSLSRPGLAAVLLASGVVVSVGAEAATARAEGLEPTLARLEVGDLVRSGLHGLLLIALVAGWESAEPELSRDVVLALALVWLARVGVGVVVAHTGERRHPVVGWRNFEVPGVVRLAPLAPGVLRHSAAWNSVAWLVLAAGIVVRLAGGPEWLVRASAACAVVLAVGLLGIALIDALRARRDTPLETTVDLLGAALAAARTEVLFYYSRPEAVGYIANVWMPTLEQVHRPCAVIVREEHNAPLVETDTLPVILVSRPTDLERVVPPTAKIALYPSNVARNNHLLRLPGIVDVFVGHGDSDKGGSATVLTRIFDEAWVSGPAARDRYRVADVGVRDDQIREIGRPQLADILRVAAPLAEDSTGHDALGSWEYTVLYAPTREGFFAEWEYSSVLSQGAGILGALLGMPGVRVLFKPHPGTGTDDPEYAAEVERLKSLVVQAGHPHEVVTGAEGLYAAFNRADLLVSDISSVITDFLASGKPYVVTNSSGQTPERFRASFPSAAGAYLLSGDGSDLRAIIEDARTLDSFAEQRRRTARYLLGDHEGDLVARFRRAIDEAIEGVPTQEGHRTPGGSPRRP